MATNVHSAPLGAGKTDTPTIQPADSIRHSTGPISEAWNRRKAAYAEGRADIFRIDDGSPRTADENRVWKIIDDAETVIQANTATTAAEIAMQVWTALTHVSSDREDGAAIEQGDLDALPDEDRDWDVRLLLSALRSLKAMEA